MSFASWLYQPEPEWKEKLEICDPKIFEELELKKEEIERILKKLQEYNII